jgi:hypothetical protein
MTAKHGEGPQRERNVTVLAALGGTNVELHPSAVDLADLEIDALADAQAAGVDGGEAGAVDRLLELSQEMPDLVNAQDHRQLVNGAWTKEVEAGPGPTKGMLEEELDRTEGNGGGGTSDAALVVEIEEILTELFLSDQVGRLAHIQGQLLDGLEIGALGMGREAAQLHVLGHPPSQWGHGRYLLSSIRLSIGGWWHEESGEDKRRKN